MKRTLLCLATACMAFFGTTTASAYEFDGIDLNAPQQTVTRAISTKGYVYNQEKNCLVGDCQGTQIYLSLNLYDVTETGHVGQLIVDIPVKDAASAITIFDVIYHQTANENGKITYAVANDGTTMTLTKTNEGIRIVYNTPYYKAK